VLPLSWARALLGRRSKRRRHEVQQLEEEAGAYQHEV
jgi:hypothetical protein